MQRISSLKLLLSRSSGRILSRTSHFHPISNNPPHHHHHHGFYSSWSSGPRLPRPEYPNGVPNRKISDGFCLNSLIVGTVLRRGNSLLVQTAQSCGLSRGSVRKGLGVQFPRRNYHSNFRLSSRRSSWFQRLTPDGLVLGLIVTNVAVFLLWRLADRSFMIKNFTISLDNIRSGRIHTLITNAFSHIDSGHIISNMIGLYFFGSSLGGVFGAEFVLKLYLAGALGGSLFYLVHHGYMALSSKKTQMMTFDSSRAPALGASGAVNAIMLLDIFLFPKKTLLFDFFIPVPAILLGIFLIGKDMLRILEGDSKISGSAHLGGATIAAVAWTLVRKGRVRF